jgi:hypothetical protein
MIRQVGLFGAVALGILLASTCAEAQTIHHRAKHPADPGGPATVGDGKGHARPTGRQIIVHAGVEPWLTLGTWAPVGSRQGYALDTLRPPQRYSNEGTFVSPRGLDRLPNDISLPQANRPLITVAWPGYSGPLLDLY